MAWSYHLERDVSTKFGQAKLVNILHYYFCDDSHCCVDLDGVSPLCGGWRDTSSALVAV